MTKSHSLYIEPYSPTRQEVFSHESINGEITGSLENDMKDNSWDLSKLEAEKVAWIYKAFRHAKVKKWGANIETCGQQLAFSYRKTESGAWSRQLIKAKLCRCKTCPICTWRRSLKIQAELSKKINYIMKENDSLRPVLLTLTVKNCNLPLLKETCTKFLKDWSNLTKRKAFSGVVGWVRSLEITRGKSNPRTAHPHIHAMLLVNEDFDYEMESEKWALEWQRTARLDYRPQVDIRPVTDTERAIIETCKYTVKPDAGGRSADWLPHVALAIDGIRTFATGGIIKAIKQDILEDIEDIHNEVKDLPTCTAKPKNCTMAVFYYAWNGFKYNRYSVIYRSEKWWQDMRTGELSGVSTDEKKQKITPKLINENLYK